MALTSMKLSAEEAEKAVEIAEDGDGPRYPYGLCLNLDKEALAKLGITELPQVGEKMVLNAIVEVTSMSQYQTQDGDSQSLGLQITDMDLQRRTNAAEKLYGSK